MKIPVSCPKCVALRNTDSSAELEVGNSNLYRVECAEGHVQKVSLPQQRHEILFEVGSYAIVDGYYREAVSSFASALERYYEFFVETISIHIGTEEAYRESWKKIFSQSERQLGAYIFSYFLTYSKSPDILCKKLVELRNKVIHKGHIPSYWEAVKFGQHVADLISDGCGILNQSHPNEIREMIRRATYGASGSNESRIHIPQTHLNIMSSPASETLEQHLLKVITHNGQRLRT